ncbi:hypothetical protein Pelo_18299 [Pelomyxa schiedti]|nr:hypothetical protein Pelo_18299 [Pelomyxa schiedti]
MELPRHWQSVGQQLLRDCPEAFTAAESGASAHEVRVAMEDLRNARDHKLREVVGGHLDSPSLKLNGLSLVEINSIRDYVTTCMDHFASLSMIPYGKAPAATPDFIPMLPERDEPNQQETVTTAPQFLRTVRKRTNFMLHQTPSSAVVALALVLSLVALAASAPRTPEPPCFPSLLHITRGQVICHNSTGGYCAGAATGDFLAWMDFSNSTTGGDSDRLQRYREDAVLDSGLLYTREYVIGSDQWDYYLATTTDTALQCVHAQGEDVMPRCVFADAAFAGRRAWHGATCLAWDGWWVVRGTSQPYTAFLNEATWQIYGWQAGGVEYIYYEYVVLDSLDDAVWVRPESIKCIPIFTP